MESLLLIVTFVLLLMLGVPVSVSMGLSSLLIIWLLNYPLMSLPQQMTSGVMSYTLMAVPFFIFAGNLMNEAGLTARIFRFASSVVGHLRGGLGQVNVLASMIFAGISGSMVADTAGLGVVEMKAMTDAKYDKHVAAAVTLCSGMIGPIIPPSIILIIYAVSARVSIARIFLAGILPGALIGLIMMIGISIMASRRPKEFPRSTRPDFREFLRIIRGSFLAVISPLIILWGMVGGMVTPTEAGILAVVWSIIVSVIYRDFSSRKMVKVLYDSFISSAHIMFLIAVGNLMGWVLTMSGSTEYIAASLTSLITNKYAMLLVINVLCLIIGCFIEPTPALLVVLPIFDPIIQQFGFDPLHFGIMLCFNLCVGMLTPPVGLGLYVMCSVWDVKFEPLTRAVIPFLLMMLIALILITYLPWLSTWLPKLIMPY